MILGGRLQPRHSAFADAEISVAHLPHFPSRQVFPPDLKML
jgi:hypothetical protein